MQKIHTDVGDLYFDLVQEKNSPVALQLYDSEQRFFSAWGMGSLRGQKAKSFVEKRVKDLEKAKTIDELCEKAGLWSYKASKNWTDLLEYMYLGDAVLSSDGKWYNKKDKSRITEKTIRKDDWLLIVGDTYIYIID